MQTVSHWSSDDPNIIYIWQLFVVGHFAHSHTKKTCNIFENQYIFQRNPKAGFVYDEVGMTWHESATLPVTGSFGQLRPAVLSFLASHCSNTDLCKFSKYARVWTQYEPRMWKHDAIIPSYPTTSIKWVCVCVYVLYGTNDAERFALTRRCRRSCRICMLVCVFLCTCTYSSKMLYCIHCTVCLCVCPCLCGRLTRSSPIQIDANAAHRQRNAPSALMGCRVSSALRVLVV